MKQILCRHPRLSRIRLILLIGVIRLIFIQMLFPFEASCLDKPFDNASNWGGTGLLEVPTARVLGDGEIRFGYAQANPYKWYAGGMGVFSWLEVSGRYTEISNISSGLGSDFGANKDKAVDLKLQILPESKRFPALALGLHDIHGTRLFDAQYLVLSRQIFPLDITLGLGRGRLNGAFPSNLGDEVGFFGGIELAITRRFHVLAEYNPIEYEDDDGPARGVPEGADSPVNFGMRMKIFTGIDLGLSWQRGDTFSFMVHAQAPLGEPLMPKKADPPKWTDVDRRPFAERNPQMMIEEICKALDEAGFHHIMVSTDRKSLTAQFENNKYLSNQKAVGRVLRILLFYSPSDTHRLNVIVRKRGIPILQISVKPEIFEKFLFGEISKASFSNHLEIQMAETHWDTEPGYMFELEKPWPDYRVGIKPSLELYFNDPSGVLKARAGIKPHMESVLWKGAAAIARYDIPFYSNIRSSNVPLPDAVRSDSWLYLDRDYSFDRLLLDQVFRLSKRTFVRISGGYLENMYAGAGGEVLMFLGKGGFALGVEADWVKKREPGTQFELLDVEAHTLLGNIYYRIPKTDITFQAQYGRFLAGDKGWMFYASREYSTGARAGFWYSYTDTDDFTGFNRDYHNKGIFLSLPASMFFTHDSTERYDYAFSPWTRDVGASVYHWSDLFRFGSDLMPVEAEKDLEDIRK